MRNKKQIKQEDRIKLRVSLPFKSQQVPVISHLRNVPMTSNFISHLVGNKRMVLWRGITTCICYCLLHLYSLCFLGQEIA